MTWLVTLTGSDFRGGEYTETVRIFSNRWIDLLVNNEYRWEMLEAMMEGGSLHRVEIDFKPSPIGVPRIEKDENGGFWLTYDRCRVGHAYKERGDAWESQRLHR